MQFPTCKAPVRKDGVRISSLFDEFASSKFTGYGKIHLGKEEHIIALKEGAYVLAESGDLKGVEAFKKIVDLGNSMAGVTLCPLTVKQFQVTLLFNAAYRIIFAEGQENVTDKRKSSQIARGPGLENRPLPAGPSITPTTRVHPVCIPSTAGKSQRVRSIKITTEQEIDEKKKKVQITRTGEGSGKATKRIEQLTLESIKELKET
ncbi:MAG: hypothetical protein LUQ17_01095, partial [Methanomicrobiales archaeon]|nr:hypothetical protein [Methanomicrobiales archaeon]